MATPKTIPTVQSLSSRELGKQVVKRTAPGVLVVGALGGVILVGPWLLSTVVTAMA